ncbi:cdp-alcohol phosphatidyltransferase [Plasmopara halstedii]|uniref:Cdp-alcohol phosphatidyltransferase n=1 Tax=Plasmopara halstedii TaxID=4781 RepID=A0A0P1A9E4_PLAHL|nr:cdp-alcohol phosphatidyltransferase [Plasmopara halstedii]CEG36705.1 cdp-alcohol phosphatidyltransferase [Plasmopara halstedii]|eukprot:XP_024573074.1 cdp-alcohol phosphatidyltransferase [Plasmopara halstedii]
MMYRNGSLSNSPTSSDDGRLDTIKFAHKSSASAASVFSKETSHESLIKRYYNATCTKMYDVEELIDYYWHRRLAAVPAVIVSYLPFVITPNQITIFGLFLGWGAALCLYDSEFHYPLGWESRNSLLGASALMFTWIVSDCTDGQVARLCKRGTRTGRILDGVVDGLVIAPNFWVMGDVMQHHYGGSIIYFHLCFWAGMSLWLHAIIYDKIKNVYMENALPQSECDGETVASVRAEYRAAREQSACALDTILLGIYSVYLAIQASFTSDAASQAEMDRQALLASCTSEYHNIYRQKFGGLVRVASFLGISAHITAVYAAYFLAIYHWDVLFYMQFYPLVLLNIVLIGVLFEYQRSGMAKYTPTKEGTF